MTVSEAVINVAIDDLLSREGGYVNNPADRGGPTNFGITLGTLSIHRGYQCSANDVKNLSEMEARAIYRSRFIEKQGFLMIDDPALFSFVVDMAANSGPRNAVRALQEALEVRVDGIFGVETIRALEAADAQELYFKALAARIRFIGRIITKNLTDADKDGTPDNTEMAAGWLNRVAAFVARGHVHPGSTT